MGFLVAAGLLWLGGGGTAPGLRAADPEPEDIQTRAKNLVARLAKGDFANAGKDFDKAMRKGFPPKEMEKLWKAVLAKFGAFKEQRAVRTEKAGQYRVVYVPCVFAKGALDVRLVFTADKEITGLQLTLPKSAVKYKAPDYVNPKAFRETEVKFGKEKWELPGTLTLPEGKGPFPAVVLVHGSGPHDRDESIGGSKPFRDLAWGLASRKIAVLRYDKRTKVHGHKMTSEKDFPSLREEVIEDALAAVKLLRGHKDIGAKKVFVVGHSLGAILLPQIGREDPAIAGLVALAGGTRPLEDAILDQFTYLYSLDGPISEEHKKELEKLKKQVARAKDPKLSAETKRTELPLGIPAVYWLDVRKYHPAKAAALFKQPILILQGERDYQVTMEDFKGWKKILEGRKNATFKSYPRLNHLFIEGKGKSRPEEYEKAGQVAREVVEDIAAWVKKQ
jgi:dienelactone hydrolase